MKPRVVFAVGSEKVSASLERGRDRDVLGEADAASWDAQRATLERFLLNGRLRECRDAVVELSGTRIQFRWIRDLPPARLGLLPGMVLKQARRYFRNCGGTPLVGIARVQDSEGESVIRAACISLEFVEDIEALLSSAGLRVVAVRAADATANVSVELRSPATARADREDRTHLVLRYALAACAVWSIAGGVYLNDLMQDGRAVSDELQTLESPLRQLERIRSEVEPVTQAFVDLRAAADEHPWMTRRLSLLSSVIPRSAYITTLEIDRSGTVRLQGATDAMVTLIARVDSSAVRPAALDSMATAMMGTPGAHPFAIQFEVNDER